MSTSKNSILFLGKKNDLHCEKALHFLTKLFDNVEAHLGEWGTPLPATVKTWKGDVIISYLSRWIVPEWLIEKASFAAINFHPASPDYPGIGCNNFALYENASSYGVTCHHMAKEVDTGSVIAVETFPVYEFDTVESLLSRTYDYQLVLFYKILDIIYRGEMLPESSISWARQPITRKEFNQLKSIDGSMTSTELEKRIRATSFGNYQPELMLHGKTFKLVPTGDH